MPKLPSYYFLIAIGLVLSSCKFQKLSKSDDVALKYQAALAYYENQDYYKAGVLLEDVIPLMKGQQEAEKAQFYFAYCQYYQGQMELAGYYFKKFYETFPKSTFAEESAYMYAMSLYQQSPKYNLDQTSTKEAIIAIEEFKSKYPENESVTELDSIVNQLYFKLEKKDYELTKLYFDLGHYRAAIVAMDNYLEKYPYSSAKEEFAYLKVLSQYKLARISVPHKKKERFIEAQNYYIDFIDSFPSSSYLKDAESIYDNCSIQIEKLN